MTDTNKRVKQNDTDKFFTTDFIKLYLATILIKSSTVQNGDSIKRTQTTHFALTFSSSFIYQNVCKTINNRVL